jgi:hypothetical protein
MANIEVSCKLCTPSCTADYCKTFLYHDIMKAELRIPIKDYRRPSSYCRSRKSNSFGGARLCLKDQPQQTMFAGGLLRLVLRTSALLTQRSANHSRICGEQRTLVSATRSELKSGDWVR